MNPQNQTTNRTQSTRSVTNQPGTLDVFQPNAGRSKRPAAWLLLLALCFGFAPALPAALRTWNGGGADINWGTAGNWGGSAVAAGDDLLFTGATKLFNSNNIVSLRINSLSYSSSGFLNVPLTNGPGYTLMITNGIVDTAGNNTNNIPLILGGSQSFSNQVANSLHVLGSTINMSNYSLTFGGAGTNFFNGIISGNGAVGANSISVNDGGIRLAAANTFNGDLNINSGTVQLGNAAAIPSGNSRGNVKMGAAAALDLGNVSPAVNGLNGVAGSLIDEITTNAGTYTFQLGTANSNGIFAGTIANSHGIINVVKAGTGAQTLSGNNTYSGFLRVDGGTLTNSGANSYFGSTIINAGSLVLAAGGSMASTNINVAPGAVFNYGGAGTLNLNGNLVAGRATGFAPDLIGDLALSGGNLTMIPGAAGTLTLNGNLTLTGGNLNFDLNNTATIGSGVNDLIVLNGGSLDISGGTTTVKIKPIAGALAGGTYTIISNSTANIVGGPANLLLAAPRGISATFDTTTQPKNLLVTASGAANPASIVWAGNGAGGNWDVVQSQNWLSNGVPDLFYDLDTVTFNDAAGSANSLVGLPNAVSPTATVVSNSTAVTYTLGTLNLDSGLISGTGGLTKNGSGTAILNAANNYTGDTTVNLGTLILGSYVTGTFVNNVPVYNGIPAANLVLGAGGVYSAGQANTFNSATFGSVTVKPGGSSISMRNRQSNNTTYFYQFNGITRQVGGTVDFNNLQTRSGSHVGMYFTNTTVSPVNGILGGYATVGLNNWIVPTNGATLGSGPLGDVAFWGATSPFNYQVNNATPSAWGSVSNVQVTATPGASLTTQTINSLKLTNSTAITVTIGAAQTLTLASGGLLNPANGGAAHSITGGNLQGAASADLIVHQNNIANALTIGSVITDNTSATALTKAGAGTLILTGNSTYSGVTYINGATINGGANATPGAAIAAGTLQIGSGATSGGISNSPSIANEGTLTFSRSDAVGYAGTISGNGGVKQSGTGTTTLTGNNTYAGATTITAGILQIGNGGASGSFSNSASVSDSTSLVINRTGTLGYAGVIAGGGSLTVQGGVNVILGGVNTHSGNTTVSAGRLTLGAAGSISNSPLISVAAGALLDASATGLALNGSGGGQTVSGSGSVSGNVSVGTSTSLAPAGAGVIGTMTLSNALAMVGGTIGIDLSAGATRDLVDVKGNLTLTSGSIALNNLGGAIPNGSYTIITYAGSLSGAVANLTVSGFSQVGQVASLSSATAGQIKLVVASGAGANLTWIGDGGNNFWDVNTSATWNNGGGASIFNNGDNVVMNDVGNANPLVNLNASLAPATVYVSATTDYTLTSIGKITGGTGLTKSNSAVLNVLTTNDNSGTTVIGGGGIVVGNGTASGSLGSGNVNNQGVLTFNLPDSRTIGGAVSGAGALNLLAGDLTLGGNNASYSGPVTITTGNLRVGQGGGAGTLGTGPVTNNGAVVFNRSGTLTYGGVITGSGTVSNIGSAAVTLSGANTYAGNTVIANGTVKAGNAAAIPSGPGLGNVVLDGSATAAGILDLNGNSININGLAGANGAVLGQVVNNTGTATNTLTLGNNDATAAFSGTIRDNTGSGGKVAIIKTGTGNQTIDIPNALGNLYTGGTVISNGTLTITSPGGNNPVNLNANQVALGSGPVTFYGGTLSVAGSLPQSTGPTWNAGMNNVLIVPAGQVGTVNGCQRGGITPSLTGSGTFNYIAAYVRGSIGGDWSAFTGQIVMQGNSNGGQIGLDSTTGFGKVYMTNFVTLYNRVAGTPVIPIGELSDDGSSAIESTTSGNAGGIGAVFAVGSLGTTTNFGGNIIDNVGITKVGAGRWTLTGATITYTGPTAVSNGVLAFASALPASATWTLGAPGIMDISALGSPTLAIGATVQTLHGNGTLRGSLDVGASGTVVVGFTNAIGTLTVTNAVTLAGTTYMELNRTNLVTGTNDQIACATITLGGTLTVTNQGSALHVGDTFKLFKASGVLSGTFGTVNLPATDATGTTYTWTDNTATSGSITVLTATSAVNQTSTNIVSSLSGNVLTLSWPADHTGWRLQVQTNSISTGLASNWVDVAGSTSVNTMNFTVNPANGSVFFRMVYP